MKHILCIYVDLVNQSFTFHHQTRVINSLFIYTRYGPPPLKNVTLVVESAANYINECPLKSRAVSRIYLHIYTH